MAQGCHLIYSAGDREHFDFSHASRNGAERERRAILRSLGLEDVSGVPLVVPQGDGEPVAVNADAARELGVPDGRLRTLSARWQDFEPQGQVTVAKVLRARPHRQYDLLSGLGNPDLDDGMAKAIPSALTRVLDRTPRAPGLFDPVRAREDAWVGRLKSEGKGNANGIAYELLATDRMLRRPPVSSTGRTLRIETGDSLAFGVKLQGRYGGGGPLAIWDADGWDVFDQGYRLTAEADLLIIRADRSEVGVDFKHSSVGDKLSIKESQLEAVWTALRTRELDEFHFVTNTDFPPKTRGMVKEFNRRIDELNADRLPELSIPHIELFSGFDWRAG